MKLRQEERSCIKHGNVLHYERIYNGKHSGWRCVKCNIEAVNKTKARTKQKCVDYLGGECNHCGYKKCLSALEFHHVNPSIKSFGINRKTGRSFATLLPELNKCILLCSNCHKEEHEKLFLESCTELVS